MTGALRVLEHHLTVYRRTWKGSVFMSFVSPVLFLTAMGLGLGSLISRGPVRTVDDVQGTPLVRNPEVREEKPHLVAVARNGVFVEDDQASTIASIASATSPARNGMPRTRLKPVASTRNSARISFSS